jgi:hypothetical protein
MWRRGVVLVLAAVGLAGCTSAPAATGLTADQVHTAVNQAAAGASAVHVKGHIHRNSHDQTVDMHLNKTSASGTYDDGTDIGPVPIVFTGEVAYFQLSKQFLGFPPVADLNKWLPSTDAANGSSFAQFDSVWYDYAQFQRNILAGLIIGKVTPAGDAVVNGVRTLVFKDAIGDTVTVAESGPHYLMRYVGGSTNPGTLDFTEWNQPTAVPAPPPASQRITS